VVRRHPLDIGNRLQRLRNAIGITQEEVARRSRVSAKFLSQVENGHSSPSIDVFMRIVELGLATPLADFFAVDADSDRDVAAIRAMLAGQPPTMRRRALRVLKSLFDE
jgi:transcriptional regulator with XRE-family HTH domain